MVIAPGSRPSPGDERGASETPVGVGRRRNKPPKSLFSAVRAHWTAGGCWHGLTRGTGCSCWSASCAELQSSRLGQPSSSHASGQDGAPPPRGKPAAGTPAGDGRQGDAHARARWRTRPFWNYLQMGRHCSSPITADRKQRRRTGQPVESSSTLLRLVDFAIAGHASPASWASRAICTRLLNSSFSSTRETCDLTVGTLM